ncbi:MAG: HD domain-containing protein [Candidatus Hodarchaeales archaeon]|jgi:uncharacterized protein
MDAVQIIQKTLEFVKTATDGESSGHDWFHAYRVWKNALLIAEGEDVNLLVVQLAALLHDIDDWKFHPKNEDLADSHKVKQWLESLHVKKEVLNHVAGIVQNLSFKGEGSENKIQTIEGKIVQDADRLDALGAIGVARVFATGAKLGSIIHDPRIPVRKNMTTEEYTNYSGKGTSINHFHEKLLLLKDMMNTETGKRIAKERHQYMVSFLNKFHNEWDGKE